MSAARDEREASNASTVQVAIARTATRALALYFSRPVRLFRPSKVNGWQTLKATANKHGHSLSPQFISTLVKQQGVSVLARHFVPPMAVNLVLGSVLWATYAEASAGLEPYISNSVAVAAMSGAAAGGAQALIAAPAENVRFLLEGGSPATRWSHAWKEVFRGASDNTGLSKEGKLREARQVRDWMREVGDMAGRGWDGWKWGVAKDTCGFALFFSIFDLTRRVATQAKVKTSQILTQDVGSGQNRGIRYHAPRIVNAVTLVTGGAMAGLVYELSCRPWDVARKAVHVDEVVCAQTRHSTASILLHKARSEGWQVFFHNPMGHVHESHSSPRHRRMHSLLRTVARVGPWGVGFLVWEAFGPGLS